VKIAYVQFSPVLGDLEATLEKLTPLIRQAAGADLVVLPELCNSGYRFESREEALHGAEAVPEGPFVSYLVERCREMDLHIVSGMNERAGRDLFNAAVLVGPKGWKGTYRKLHLFRDEKDLFAPGDLGLPVFEVRGCRIGMLVCFDWVFPEAWRVLALRGADIICHPANLVLAGFAQKAVPVHALTNRVFAVTSNRIGTERDLVFTGRSLICDPRGEVLAEAPPSNDHVGLAAVDLSLARDKRITDRNHLFLDRRPDQYTVLCHPS